MSKDVEVSVVYASCIACVGIGEKRGHNSPCTILKCIVGWNGVKVGLIEAYEPICAHLKRSNWSGQMIKHSCRYGVG